MLIRKCDRCKREIKNYVNIKQFTNVNVGFGCMTANSDETKLCMDCFKLFKEFMSNQPVGATYHDED